MNLVLRSLTTAVVLTAIPSTGYASETVDATLFGATPNDQIDDSDAIQRALNDGAGKTVLLPIGVFLVNKGLAIPSNTALSGAGGGTVLKAPSSADALRQDRWITNADITAGNRNISLSDLALDIQDFHIPGANPGLVRFHRVDGLTIDRVHAPKADSRYAIIDLAAGNRRAVIRNCVLANTHVKGSGGALWIRGGHTDDPIQNFDSSPDDSLDDSFDITVSGNTLESALDEALSIYGWNNTVSRVLVTGNVISNRNPSTELAVGILGYNVAGQDGFVQDITVSTNTIVGRTQILTGARRVVLSRNIITGPVIGRRLDPPLLRDAVFVGTSGGPGPSHVVVEDNSINGAGRYGIWMSGRYLIARGNLILSPGGGGVFGGSVIGNTVVLAERGYGVQGAKTVIGNDITGGSIGIHYYGDSSDIMIQNNTITNPSTTGVSLNGNGSAPERCVIEGNTIRSVGLQVVAGIHVHSGTFTGGVLAGNKVYVNSGVSFEVPAGFTKANNYHSRRYENWP